MDLQTRMTVDRGLLQEEKAVRRRKKKEPIRPAEPGYFNNYLIDNKSCVIVGVQATTARLSQESAAAREMITRSAERRGRFPQSVAADTTYGNGELLAWFVFLHEESIT